MANSGNPGGEAARWLLEQGKKLGGVKRWPFYILLFLSWLSTTTGLMTLVQASRGDDWLAWIPVGLLVFAATWIMKDFVDQVFDNVGFRQKFVAIVGYLFLMFVSVFFSFGFYWGLIEAPAQQLGTASTATTQILNQVQTSQAGLEQITRAMTGLRDYSLAQSQKEQAEGNTCGEQTPRVCGPRCQFRLQQASEFQNDSQRLNSEVSTLQRQISRITGQAPPPPPIDPAVATDGAPPAPVTPTTGEEDATAFIPVLRNLQQRGVRGRADEENRAREFQRIENELNGFVNTYNAFRTGGDLTNFAQRYSALARDYESNAPVFQYGVSQFSCPDSRMSDDLDLMVERIGTLPPMERITIPPPGGAAAILVAFRRLGTTLFDLVTFRFLDPQDEPTEEERIAERMRVQREVENERANAPIVIPPIFTEPAREGLRESDYLALVPALVVDILIFLLGMSRTTGGGFRRAAKAIEAAKNAQMTLPVAIEQMRAKVEDPNFTLLESYTISHLGRRYLAIPHQIESNEDRVVANIAEILVEEGRATRNASPFWVNSDGQVRKRLEDIGSPVATRRGGFAVYRLSPNATMQSLWEFMAHTDGAGSPPVDI